MNLLKDSVKGLILKLALPIMAMGLLRASYEMVDMIFASRLGGLEVASVAFVTPIFRFIMALGEGLTVAGVSLIAKKIGERKISEASSYAHHLRLIIILSSVIIAILGTFLSDGLLIGLGLKDGLLRESSIYTKIRFISIPFILLFQVYLSLNNAQGKTNMALKMSIVGIVSNIIFNSIFIFGLKSGIGGLAYATTISQVIQALSIMFLFHSHNHDFKLSLNIFSGSFNGKISKELFRVGLPLAFSQSSTNFGFLLMNMFIVPYGYEVVAAFSIGNQINALFFAPTTGIGQSLVPLIAQNYGNRSYKRLKESIRFGLIFTMLTVIVGIISIQSIAHPFGSFLSKGEDEILKHVLNFLYLCSWSLIGWGIYQSLSGIFTGFQMTKTTMTINLVRLWGIRIPGLILFRYVFTSVGEYGVWISQFISNFGAAIFAVIIFKKNILDKDLLNK